MGRPLRVECADGFFHVLARGNDRRRVFRDDTDRRHFLDLLGLLADRFEVEPWAYVLMPTHYHLVLRPRRPNLSRAMHWLAVAYTNGFNARHRRGGHLFRGRFKAFLVEDEDYLRRLLLYVHRNPLRARLVERLADWPWSSYRALAYRRGGPAWFRPDRALGLFDGRPDRFRQAVRAYSEEDDKLLGNLWHGVFLGSRQGLEALAERLGLRRHPEKPQTGAVLRTLRGAPLARAVAEWAAVLGLAREDVKALRHPKRHVRRPMRDVLMYLAWREGGARLADIGAYFRVGYTSVAAARRRAETHLRRHPALRHRLRDAGIIDN